MIYFIFLLSLLLSCNNSNSSEYQVIEQASNEEPAVLYRSTDEGKSWNAFANGIPKDATISEFMEKENSIYATTDFHGVFSLDNQNETWKAINKGLPKKVDINAIEVMDDQIIIGTLHQGIYTSNNKNINWKKPASDISNTPIRALVKLENHLFAGTDKGVYLSLDQGNTWKHLYGNMQVLGFAIHGDKIYAGVFNGAIGSMDSGKNWKYIYQEDALHDIAHDDKYLYAMTLGMGLLKSKDNGQTWEQANYGLSNKDFYTNDVVHLGDEQFSAQWIGIYHSKNHGAHWTQLTGGLPYETAFGTLHVTKKGLLAGIAIRE